MASYDGGCGNAGCPICLEDWGENMTRGQVAGAERKAKEREPARFCRFKDCLWRLKTWAERDCGWCPRHEPQAK